MNTAKILVWVMSGLLLAGLGVLAVGLSLGWHLEDSNSTESGSALQSFRSINLDQPSGSVIEGVAALGDQIAITVSGGGLPQRLVVVEPSSGAIVGTIAISTGNEESIAPQP